MTLDQLSAAATEGEWSATSYGGIQAGGSLILEEGDGKLEDALLAVLLVNAYRTGQLVAVSDDAVERVARTLAPNLEGGREFDQMPKDRAQLRQWTAQGMCLINDATQDDATWLAQEAIKAAKGTGDERSSRP